MARSEKQARQDTARESDALAAATAHLAGLVAGVERSEERLAGRLADTGYGVTPKNGKAKRQRALLIINTKSGPNNDSIGRVRDVVDLLAGQGIDADVRVKLRKRQARQEARRAAQAGLPLVIAAGGDGTIEAVAAGLVGTETILGIIPLGTYNNVAGCLGLPLDVAEACALVGAGTVRRIDVGQVYARGRKKPRIFLEMAAAGVTAALMPAGQDAKKGAWDTAAQAVPEAMGMSPTPAVLRLDGDTEERQANTLLVEVANAPRMGPAFEVAPHARMDDGLLDLAVYHDLTPAGLAARMMALKAGAQGENDTRIERLRARKIELRTATPLPVIADSKVVGTTPARFEVLPGALRVIAGHGPGLVHPVGEVLLDAVVAGAHALAAVEAPTEAALALPAPKGNQLVTAAASAIAPAVGRALSLATRARRLAWPAALVAGGAVVYPAVRALVRASARR